MSAAVSASTASVLGCAPAPGGPSSRGVAPRVAIASRPDSRSRDRVLQYRSLRGHGGFSLAYRNGTRRRCGAITSVVAAGPAGPPTVGFVCSKKIGAAVVRNRAKRRMRAATSRCVLKGDTVYILIADRGVLTADFDKLVSWIGRCTADLTGAEEKR